MSVQKLADREVELEVSRTAMLFQDSNIRSCQEHGHLCAF
jgi:hypothetical protein